MMKPFLILAALYYSLQLYAQDYYYDMGVASYYGQFQPGSVQLLYGDNVVLRKKPSADAKAIDTLGIASEVTILQNTKEPILINGRKSTWYKVKTANTTGYIAGGLIALDTAAYNGGMYLVIAAGAEDDMRFRVRYLKNGDYYGKEGRLGHGQFGLEVDDNRGIKSIEGMLIIQLFAEACGHDGGQHYIFNDGERLYNAMHCSSVADGGVFWFDEKLEFPDEREWGDHVTYTREFGEFIDEELNLTREIVHQLPLTWTENGFEPNIQEINFAEHNE
jgi:hypothetical protein